MDRVPVHGIDHVMVAVTDLERAAGFYGPLFGTDFFPVEDGALAPSGFGPAAMSAEGIELVVAEGAEAAAFVESCGEAGVGFALRVPDVDAAVDALTGRGMRLVGKAEHATRKEAAFHPGDLHGVMLKVVEYLPSYSVGDIEVVNAWRTAQGDEPRPRPRPEGNWIDALGIDHVIMYMQDLDAARARYGELLHTRFPEPHGRPGSSRMSVDGIGLELIGAGKSFLNVDEFLQSRQRGGHSGDGIAAVSFAVVDFGRAVAALADRGIEAGGTRDLPTRKVALYTGKGEAGLGLGLELIEYRRLAHPITCLDMVTALRR